MKPIAAIIASISTVGLLATACTSNPDKSDLTQKVAGVYASESENEFDYFKDTLEIKATDDGRMDIMFLARWSSAKKDDPQRPVNKVAGVWNNHGKGKTLIADLQASDTTLRIAAPMDESVTIVPVDLENGSLSWPHQDGTEEIFVKINP
ncbi:hypothetical protein GCM10011386_38670 [Parapedobacter defluvii]|uniref:Lipoprotein n=1 Tax=Parapedobacter defluvii TaxID=2045106 RepID=A0ABQ1MLM5_9SPHI|nr:hypothetical protein [Parapedobacter defluvii]GGC42704.1 hypothetical protein GCM10011386_38670 [Parapedobacter defluvii]